MKHFLFFIFITFFSSILFAKIDLDLLSKKLKQIKTLDSQFEQIIEADHEIIEESTGKIILKRPNQLYWKSENTPKQLIIADGQQVYIYDPELEQVIIKSQTQLFNRTPASLLIGNSQQLKKLFDVKQVNKMFILKPKLDKNYQKIELNFQKNSSIPEIIRFVDALNQVTTIYFKSSKLNQAIDSSLFKFKVPEGVDVVQ